MYLKVKKIQPITVDCNFICKTKVLLCYICSFFHMKTQKAFLGMEARRMVLVLGQCFKEPK